MTARDGVTIVTQTRVRPGSEEGFARFQQRISAEVTAQPEFVEQSVLPPNPPVQVDWVILQRFSTLAAATAWLHSDRRLALLAEVQPLLAGVDDVHLVRDAAKGALPSPVSAVISTQVKPGQAAAYRRWEQRIAAAQARWPGFQGYRLEPPIPGVQENYLAILRFESETALQGWMTSPERAKLLSEAQELTETLEARIVRSGFTQWFTPDLVAVRVPAWKQNMIVLLLLYPVVFLFGLWVQAPLLMRALGLPFWLALFAGNVASVLLLNVLVPWTADRFAWWLAPRSRRVTVDIAGTAVVLMLYLILMAAFSQF